MRAWLVLPVILCAGAVRADFATSLGSGWRVTVGGQANFGANGRLGVKPGAIPLPADVFTSTRAAAKAANDAARTVDSTGRQTFRDGSFVDPNDDPGVAGETWNWRTPGQRFSYADAFSEYRAVHTPVESSDRDGSNAAGASFGLDRSLWQDGAFGVDLGFNFAFFICDDWFKGSAGGVEKTETFTEGVFRTDVDMGNADVFSDPWAQNDDGTYGSGSFYGPGPVLDLGQVGVTHSSPERSRTVRTRSAPLAVRGDLQTYEFQLAGRPFYELTDWFRMQGTLGAGCDYRRFDVRAEGLGGGVASDCDAYMVCGLGGLFHREGFCLGFDFLHKAFADDLAVDTDCVSGHIGGDKWSLRFYVGYEF